MRIYPPSRPTANTAPTVLLVEDNPGDIRLVQETWADAALTGTAPKEKDCKNGRGSLEVVHDGVEAIAYLRRQGKYAQSPRPDLILLDLNLPCKNGSEVLAEIKNDDSLKQIPVVILTASQAEEDIAKAYNLYANCYIVKSIDLNEFTHAVQAIRHFWLSIVELPEE